MSDGKNLLSAILRESDVASLMDVPASFFVEDEIPVYDFVLAFYREYHTLPSARALATERHSLPSVPEPIQYYKDRCRKRAIYQMITPVIGEVSNELKNYASEAALARMQTLVTEAAAIQGQSAISTLEAETANVMLNYHNRRAGVMPTSIPFGIPYLDNMTGGMQKGDVTLIAARPHMGKSQVLLKIVANILPTRKKILLVSMEMNLEQITRRFIGVSTRINPKLIREGHVSHFSNTALDEFQEGLGGLETMYMVAGGFSSKLKDLESYIVSCNPDIVFIDAGYLLQPDTKGFKSRHETIASVIEGLKNIAMRYDVPICTTVQINREGGKKKNIGLENLAETDTLGQLSSIAMVLN